MRVVCLLLMTVLPCTASYGEEPSPKAPTFEDRVNRAVDRGVAWLKAAQQKDGSWGPCVSGRSYSGEKRDRTCYTTGPTSFSLFTLAKCGVGRKDPVVKRGLRWLRKQLKHALKTHRTLADRSYASYESASVILMLTALYEKEEPQRPSRTPVAKPRGSPFSKPNWRRMHECVVHLVGEGKHEPGCQTPGGGFAYYVDSSSDEADVSATQFALLALRAAVRAGYPLDRLRPDVWRRALSFLQKVQQENGAYPYEDGKPWSAAMTAAGLASLLICREQLSQKGERPDWLEERVDAAFDHLGEIYDPKRNVRENKEVPNWYHYCYLYAVERVGSLARRHLLGKKDWYRTGARTLIQWQSTNGCWVDKTCMRPEDVLGTCFALLFLKRATRGPVVTGGSASSD